MVRGGSLESPQDTENSQRQQPPHYACLSPGDSDGAAGDPLLPQKYQSEYGLDNNNGRARKDQDIHLPEEERRTEWTETARGEDKAII